eukprot:CAMPEP_0194314384 /NCGR_PEP_ID=MMETSP0171-20130528/11222_1 /TAXON_ID=218684 /ORGANISM="Corethron pennatum, Strain L29A3" /LENGTH=336 /DNA_ID=CAMNT_0039069775 /DNA_START=70 /DNA_END=1080 /DNA_ORIENTATION=+
MTVCTRPGPRLLALLLVVASSIPTSDAFSVLAPAQRPPLRTHRPLRVSTAPEAEATTAATAVLAPARFIVQNRFRVRRGREAAFEKRWADRESRMGSLPGFRFFCMLRRIARDGAAVDDADPNYVSCTVWQTIEDFNGWRTGDAFKEAHGGGTVAGVASMLLATAKNTYGKPKPAYWRGLLPTTVAGAPPTEGAGWGQVTADGKSMLDTECFVAMNRFSVKAGLETSFEEKFAARESVLEEYEGFKGFLLFRRDGGKKPGDGADPDDGFTHSTFSVWAAQENFDAWMADSKKKATNKDAGGGGEGGGGGKPPPIYTRPPVPTFYEGLLVLESAEGL